MLDERYKQKLRESLRDVPLTQMQIDQVFDNMVRHFSFLAKKGPFSNSGTLWNFRQKIEQTAKLLGIDKKTYIEKAVLEQPSLFYQSPETINANIEQATKLLVIDKKTYIKKAALKQPSLFCQLPETINNNIEQTAKLLGIGKKTYIEQAALKKPQLFSQSPKTINANIEQASKMLGIDKKTYIEKLALKQPPLFCQSPKTIYKNFCFLEAAHKQGFVLSENLKKDLMTAPIVLSMATSHTTLRGIHATITGKTFKLSSYFTNKSRKAIEEDVIGFFIQKHRETGKGYETLKVLHENKIISRMPELEP